MIRPDKQTGNSPFDKEPAEGSREIVERELKRQEEKKQSEPQTGSEPSKQRGKTESQGRG